MLAREGDGAAAAGQAHAIGDLGDGADLEELVLVARDEHDTLVLADVIGERDAHAREDDGVVEGNQPQQLLRLGRLCLVVLCRCGHELLLHMSLRKFS